LIDITLTLLILLIRHIIIDDIAIDIIDIIDTPLHYYYYAMPLLLIIIDADFPISYYYLLLFSFIDYFH
jgi:hypothetical protein